MNRQKFYGLTNDYMFHVALERSPRALKNLVAAVLGFDEEEILSCVVKNPIRKGMHIDEKDCILDLMLLLNDNQRVNLEMQVRKESNWTDRTLYYWSRSYAKLNKGEDYQSLKKVSHIGILDHTLFTDAPEFFGRYGLYNLENGKLYSDKLDIRVMSLNNIALARPGEEKLAYWAKIFKAKSWEELESYVCESEAIEEMIYTMKELTADEIEEMRLEAREDYEKRLRGERHAGREEGHYRLLAQLIEEGLLTAEAAASREKMAADEFIQKIEPYMSH